MVEKKKFFDVRIPLLNRSVKLLGYSLKGLEDRSVKIDLTRQLRGKSLELTFRVGEENGKAVARPKKLLILPFFIRRVMRESTSYVEDSFSAECKDAVLRIKPFLITRKKVPRSLRKTLRDNAKSLIIEEIKDKNVEEIFSLIIENRFQRSLSIKLKKIYPLILCEIKRMEIERLRMKEKLDVKEEKISMKNKRKARKR